MKEEKTITCIGCPMGCQVTAVIEDGEVTGVTGNTCAIGDRYARKEVVCPMRVVTSTVRVAGGNLPVVSVKTNGDIPKKQIAQCMRQIRDIKLTAPVAAGDVVVKHIVGTDVDVIATKDIQAV
jgi:CxxC motif-containing protein